MTRPAINPIRWRILDNSGGELFLLAESPVASSTFVSATNSYADSNINIWLNNDLFQCFTSDEQSIINTNSDGDKVYLLSQDETSNSAYFPDGRPDLSIGQFWWLRTPWFNADDGLTYRCLVMRDGSNQGSFPNGGPSSIFVRPALKLSLASVLFASSADSGVPETAGETLLPVTSIIGDMKLTIEDSTQTLAVGAVTANGSTNGSEVAIEYSGATTSANNYLCVELASGSHTYRGVIKALTAGSESGTATFKLAADITAGYTLRFWNEQYNTGYLTNYASTPVSKDIPFTSPAIASDSSTMPAGVAGIAYTIALNAEDGLPPYTWSAAGLPDGLTLSTHGILNSLFYAGFGEFLLPFINPFYTTFICPGLTFRADS